ncbi:uncharacterized protein BDW70DRAFT_130066 [Aspergillus foveolatus]|uniref:uncharacterized protein n=1 Tax=Aspergillus foveolatus TaxID=210207 RepID=UPI003CCDAB10
MCHISESTILLRAYLLGCTIDIPEPRSQNRDLRHPCAGNARSWYFRSYSASTQNKQILGKQGSLHTWRSAPSIPFQAYQALVRLVHIVM